MCTQVNFIDPSELLRPEREFVNKSVGRYRDYSIDHSDRIKERVRKTYLDMHTFQCVQFVIGTIMDTLSRLNELIDESDPDVDIPNINHAFQTAERIRKDHPLEDWFHLTGLIHDLGKVMIFYGEPQWAVVGDTFPVGCAWAKSIVYRDNSFGQNPDSKNPLYSSKYGIHRANCGLDNVMMSWGHDEYLYRVLVHNNTSLPKQALYMIRYHSFYPWHTGNDYDYLCNDIDLQMKQWVLEFNKYDLYTKSDEIPDIENLKPYYESLINKYIPGYLYW